MRIYKYALISEKTLKPYNRQNFDFAFVFNELYI